MAKQLVAGALFAGIAAGLIAFLLQLALINPLSFEAELYESGVRVHFQASLDAPVQSPAGPDLDRVQTLGGLVQDGGFSIISYTAYALMLVAAMALAIRSGHTISARTGLIWGAAAFVAFQLAPALGLPPKPPGMIGPEVGLRQTWYLGCVLATAIGLGLFAFGRGALPVAAGIVLIALPHVIGAPKLDTYFGIVPPELAGEFATASLAVSAVGWAVLGLVAGFTLSRMQED